jgi:hypothetical protein
MPYRSKRTQNLDQRTAKRLLAAAQRKNHEMNAHETDHVSLRAVGRFAALIQRRRFAVIEA